jgi:tetratricopeptide (TPR) repeat protein
MRWEQRAVPFTIRVDTPAISARSLRNQLRGRAQFEWQPWMEAANYLLAQHLDANDTVKDAEQSIAIEDRFENEMTLSQALTTLGRGDEASAARKKALALGSQPQIHAFARALQAQGRQEEAIELFRENMRKDPSSWVGRNEAARLAVVKGDFDTAVREMTLATSASPDALRGQHADLVRRLKNHEDINK